jgi:hypothetical protein
MRQRYSAPISIAAQEGRLGKATSRAMARNGLVIGAKRAGKRGATEAGTMVEGVRKPQALIVIVVTLVAYGCPTQAIVHAFGLDERTVARWQWRAGKHCQQVHEAVVQQGRLDLVQGPPDEMRVKGRQMIAWMGLAMMVSTRLWLEGVVQVRRDRHLADRLLSQVRACCQPVRALLVCTNGWSAYPNSIRRAFREKVKTTAGRGRACLQVWPDVFIATVIKRTAKKRVVEVIRRMLGRWRLASEGVALTDLLERHALGQFLPQTLEPFLHPSLRRAERRGELSILPVRMLLPQMVQVRTSCVV